MKPVFLSSSILQKEYINYKVNIKSCCQKDIDTLGNSFLEYGLK